jgi:hypothetical protein
MFVRRAGIVIFVMLSIASAVSAQQSSEFGRATGGDMVLTPKRFAPFSGSLSLSLSSGNSMFGRGSSPGYGVTAGGTLVQDRLWFFGTASRQQSQSRFGEVGFPANATSSAIGARVDGQIGSAHDFSAFFDAAQRPQFSTPAASSIVGVGPSSFLSLRYDGVVSSNMFFSASFARSSRAVNGLQITPAQ